MVDLTGTFSRLQPIRALVVGDFMLDRYTFGDINRISPEAPVISTRRFAICFSSQSLALPAVLRGRGPGPAHRPCTARK